MNAPTLLFLVLAAFVVGVAAGFTIGKFWIYIICRYAPCGAFHLFIVRLVEAHIRTRPYCQIQWLMGTAHEDSDLERYTRE